MLISIKVEPSVYLLLAWAFGKAGQSEKAGELLALARMVADMKDKLDKRKSAYQDIVETSCAIEQFGPACQIAEEIDSVSTRIRSYVCIAQAHLQRDQTDKARTFLSLAVEALRTVPEIMENKLLYREVTLTRLRAGYSPERAGVFPADSKMKDEVCREVAFHLVKRGDLGTAERFAEQMENADAVYDKLALAYARKGQIDKASALLRKLGHAFYGEATFLALGEAKARVNQAPALAQWVSGLPPGPARCYACIGIARKMLANAR
jgi:hypothetical protein